MKKFFIFLIVLYSVGSYSQAPSIAWQKLIGGSNSEIGSFISIVNDNSVFIGSRSNSNISGYKSQNTRGGYDYWIVKVSENGDFLWDKTIGAGPVSILFPNNDITCSVNKTSDGSILIGGFSESSISGEKTEVSRGDFDYWLVKLDVSGNIIWDKTIGGSSYDGLNSFFESNDGNYIIVGTTLSTISGEKTEVTRGGYDIWMLKLDIFGNIIWQKTIGGSGGEGPAKMIQTSDNGYIIAATSNSNISGEKTENSYGLNDYWIIKLDSNGNIQWQKTIGGSGNEYCSVIVETTDGEYLVGGYSDSDISGLKTENSRGGNDFWVVKLTALGEISWQKTIGGSNDDSLLAMIQCLDNGYVLSGTTLSSISGDKTDGNRGDYDAWVVKLDEMGNLQWQKNIGGTNYDGLNSVSQLPNGSFIMAGGSRSSNSFDVSETNQGLIDIWLVKLNAEDLSSTGFDGLQGVTLYPNPASNMITVDLNDYIDNLKVTVSSVLGQVISQYNYTNQNRIDLELPNASGVYLVTLESESKNRRVFKVIKQ